MKPSLSGAVAALLLAAAASSAAAAEINVLPAHWSVITTTGVTGVLRPGSVWAPAPAPAGQTTIVDGVFAPENQQWDVGSLWWDEDPRINAGPVVTTIQLDQAFTFDRFVVQADDNDSYLLEYWTGSAWQNAFSIGPTFTFGLVTRDSGATGPFTTDQFRFTATGGDNYYAVSEIQGFAAVPEPASWALMIAGFGGLGLMLRRRRAALGLPA